MQSYNQANGMLTIQEVSDLLHVHSNTLRRWTDQGMMKTYRIGPRGDRRFRAEDVDVFLRGASGVVPIGVNK